MIMMKCLFFYRRDGVRVSCHSTFDLTALENWSIPLSMSLLRTAMHLRTKICHVTAEISIPFCSHLIKKNNHYEMNGFKSRDWDK